jgi:EAL domain-containing protein (putative c-di-GMP-specific phosphodiesterase class I)
MSFHNPPADPLEYVAARYEGDVPSMVAAALKNGRARLAVHPVVTARAPHRILYHEGLVRLLDPRGGVIPARLFVGTVEETSLGRALDTAALRLGLAALRRYPSLVLSLNMSLRSMGDRNWRATLDAALDSAAIGHRLIFEVGTASAMVLPELLADLMSVLRPRGVTFALDDFGNAPVDLPRLVASDFDIVKIHRRITQGITETADQEVLAEVLIDIADHLGMEVIAQGIETPDQARLLARLGAQYLQGFRFGAPKLLSLGPPQTARQR